ncbi:MAG: hypothetical protein ACTSPB_04490 [Candidatus Thorarchaeota archaeon]
MATLPYDIQTVRLNLLSIIQAQGLIPIGNATETEDLPLIIHGSPFNPKTKTSVDNACTVITVQDFSDWTELTDLDTGVVITGSLTLVYVDNAGTETVCGTSEVFDFGFRHVFEAQFGDGEYCLVADLLMQSDSLRDVPFTYRECVCLRCCTSKKESLLCRIKKSIADLSCVIVNRRRVGRNVTELQEDLYKMLAYRDFLLNCECTSDIDTIECGFNRIPKHC